MAWDGRNTAILGQHNLQIWGSRSRPSFNRLGSSRYSQFRNTAPGPNNVLGRIKFVFPNKHDVYMHDTTLRNYYGQSYRDESHGCMRVQNPDQFALALLKHDQGWTRACVADAIRGRGDNHVVLQQKIPVYISYFTLKVNDDGSISTFRDLYGHDARMADALGRKSGADTPTKDNKATSQSKPSGKRRTRPDGALTNNFARTPFGF
jgi:hypothetical protein